MSAVTCKGIPVLHGEITHPRVGNWTATLDLVSETVITGSAVLKSFDDRWTLSGFVVRAEVFADTLRVFLVGGKGGLSKVIAARAYVKVPARTVAQDILEAAGEKLASASKIEGQLERWSYTEGRADSALTELAEFLGLTWRVNEAGEVWFGKDTYPTASDPEASFMESSAASGTILLHSPAPYHKPGTTVEGKHVETVVHSIAERIATRLFVDGEDRVRGALRTLVSKAFPFDRYAQYFCKVVSQNSDGTLELKPDSPKLSGFSKVPIKLGIPGVKVKVKPGARVALGWDGADPSKPIATVWDAEALDEITITAKTKVTIDAPMIVCQNGRPIARVGDRVFGVSTPPGTPFIATIATGNANHKG